jgi:6-phosphogluconolactonase (cycloisomerase 2 family)
MRTLSAIATLLLASGGSAQSTTPALFVANNGNLEGSVSSYRVAKDGSLALVQKLVLGQVPQSSQFDPGLNAYSIGLSPSGRFLAIGHATSSQTVERISIVAVHEDATLSLHAVDTTPDSPLGLVWLADNALAVTRTSLSQTNQVIVYRFDERLSGAGALTQIDAEPTGGFTTALAVNADRSVLFANDSGGNAVRAFAIGEDGTLELVATASTAPHYPLGIGCSPDGSLVYGGGGISGDGKRVVGLAFDGDGGTLAPLPQSPFASPGSSPKLVRVDAERGLAFVGHGTDATIRVLAIDAKDGSLADTGFAYDIGFQGTLGDATLLGGRLYASDNSTIFDGLKGVRAFEIGFDGALAEIGSIVDSTGVAPTFLAAWAPPNSGLLGDLDGDGEVGSSDLAMLLGAWGPCIGACLADLDGDGSVGPGDVAILLGAWTS